MAGQDLKAIDPAAYQPTREDMGIDATPEALAWAVTRGGAEREQRTGARDGTSQVVSS